MLLLFICLGNVLAATSLSTNSSNSGQNKTKRTLNGQILNHPGVKPIIIYHFDNANSQSNPVGYEGIYTPPKLVAAETTGTKQVAAQQVVYEFEQTPTNAVSNVHVKQLFQPVTERGLANFEEKPNTLLNPQETVTNPVHHSTYIHHGQNFARVHHPLYNIQPQHVQVQQYIPGKYLYVNGKITQQPQLHQQHPNHNYQNQHHPQLALQQQQQQQRPSYPYNQHYQQRPVQTFHKTPHAQPGGFHPPARHQMQQITNPIHPKPVYENQKEEDEEEEPKHNEQQEEEEVDDDKADYNEESKEEEEEDPDLYRPEKQHHLYGKYSFDDDEDDHEGYHESEDNREEEELEDDEDNERGSSKHIPRKSSKKVKPPTTYDKNNRYSFKEGFSSSFKYQSPKKGSAKPKKKYKKVKYSSGSHQKPRYEEIEGKQSKNIPITHKHKFLKEKWFVTKSLDD